jgi:5-deoxy-5-amino-3-dehydroquinate synthase
MNGMRRIPVRASRRAYGVAVGRGALGELAGLVGERRKVAVVSQPTVVELYGERVRAALADTTVELFPIGDGEHTKSLATVEDLCRRFATWGLLRDDAVVALGGGMVGDTAGFAAATYCRGLDVVQAPTTLLAQVDAAIGGKTGVNLPEGKNLVGAFHQPLGVLADVETLTTLPEREYRSGLGEVAKYALLGDLATDPSGLIELLRVKITEVLTRDLDTLTDLVARCAAIKAEVVAADEEERTGLRATLNYGHTLAHALETAGGYELTHGEAVAIGLLFAARLAQVLGRTGLEDADRHLAIVASLGLPTTVPEGAYAADLIALMARDKKAHGGVTFVLRGRNGLEQVDDPSPHALEQAFRYVGVEG